MTTMMTATENSTTTDAELIERFRQDRDEGIRGLLAAHGGRVRAVLRRRYGQTLDASLIDSALYASAERALARFDAERCELGPWFLFIADREAVSALRGERRHRERRVDWGDLDRADPRPTPVEKAESAELAAALREVLARLLTDLERTVIEADLDVGGSASAAILSEALGTTEQSIYAARSRARAKLLESTQLKKHLGVK